MKKVEVLNRLENAGVIAVLRTDSKEEALKVSHAVIVGGIMD